jgi:hypothetical protein
MRDINKVLHRPAAGAIVALTVATLGLSACGGSTKSASSHTNTAVTSTASTTSASTPTTGSGSSSGSAAKPPGGAPGRTSAGASPAPQSPGAARFKDALSKFAACLRQNGVNIPAPNTSGKGPVFSTKGLQTNTPKFRQATTKCRSVLLGAFRAGAKR